MKLHNGIEIEGAWPPQDIIKDSLEPLPVPYLEEPPALIPIDIGRQLFVDDFLIADTTLEREYQRPDPSAAQQVLEPETELEMNQGFCPMAAPFNDGAWYDPADGKYKLWYQAGWFDGTALAISDDGIHWQRPALDVVSGTNRIDRPRNGYIRDGGMVWLDQNCPESQRYKMFLFFRFAGGSTGEMYTSADGVHWNGPEITSKCGDNTTFFFNPFLEKYIFSMRHGWREVPDVGRARSYHQHSDFINAGRWQSDDPVPWARTDKWDSPEESIGDRPQLYDLNAVAYESIMLGAFAVFYGPQNPVCAKIGRPKIIDVQMAFSRDGFHWYRPDRDGFIRCTRNRGDWNYGYTHAAGGLCLVVDDTLRFYYGTFSGESPVLKTGETGAFEQRDKMYAGASTGMNTIRRDGFASMNAGGNPGYLTTRPLIFSGRYLFINADVQKGRCRAEILDENLNPIEPFTIENSVPFEGDSTKNRMTWRGAADLSKVAGREVRFRFHLANGSLYSFWVSAGETGCSNGYVAAGGPGYSGDRDV